MRSKAGKDFSAKQIHSRSHDDSLAGPNLGRFPTPVKRFGCLILVQRISGTKHTKLTYRIWNDGYENGSFTKCVPSPISCLGPESSIVISPQQSLAYMYASPSVIPEHCNDVSAIIGELRRQRFQYARFATSTLFAP
jgi:hypothetical protein